MSQPKKNSCAWLTPSFDFVPSKKPLAQKRHRSLTPEDEIVIKTKSSSVVHLKKTYLSSLSDLLAACEPRHAAELSVSRQKQQEICDWLKYQTKRGKPSALVLSGPSGCGKTVAFKFLASQNGFEVIEWITPLDQAVNENNRVMRQGDRFEDYLIRATRYNSVLEVNSRRLLLVKDFPNIYFKDKDSFHTLLGRYFEMGKEPIVFVCTDTGHSGAFQILFPTTIRERFGIDHVSTNPVTQTVMKNVLKRVSTVLNIQASQLVNVSQQAIDEVLSSGIGDIRSSIMNLIFSSLKVPESVHKSESRGREESLGLLHAIGRVINPKRITEGDSWKFVHDPDEIAFFFGIQPTTFLRFLHENHLNTLRGIEEASKATEILSVADYLATEWRDPTLGAVALSFCIRGLMVINDKPVSAWNPVRKPQNDDWQIRRDLASAEVRWYESLINPKTKSSSQFNRFND